MNHGTCVAYILFYIFRHYKRMGILSNKREMMSDLNTCYLLLKQMEKNGSPEISADLVRVLIVRIRELGANIEYQQPLRYVDIYDHDILMIMIRLTGEILAYLKKPFYKRFSNEIFKRFLALHNLPRVLLYDSSGDLSTQKGFHLTKQTALEYASLNPDMLL